MIMVDINITLDFKSFQMFFYAKPINQYSPKTKKLYKTNAKTCNEYKNNASIWLKKPKNTSHLKP